MPADVRTVRSAPELIEALSQIHRRAAGSDAERRAASLLVEEIRGRGRAVERTTFWCRPSWALAQSWHVALALAGSLVSVGAARVGAAMILVALLSMLADWSYGTSPGRRLTFERASQNIHSRRPAPAGVAAPRVRLIVTANYDAGQAGLVYREPLRGLAARARAATGGRAPGWAAWLALATLWVLVTGLLRVEGDKGTGVAVLQLVPTVGLVLGLALLLELASSEWTPGAGDNASGVAAALALTRALDAAPPANASVELLLTGAGDAQGIGLRRYLRAHRRDHNPTNTVVLGIGPCAGGGARWLTSDGPLAPLRFFRQLETLGREAAALDPGLGFTGVRSRGCSPALPARMAGIPAITIGCLDRQGLAPRSHQADDTADAVAPESVETIVQAGLLLVDCLDAYLATLP